MYNYCNLTPLQVKEVQVLGIFVHKKGPAESGILSQTFLMSRVIFLINNPGSQGNEKVKILLQATVLKYY